MRVHVYVDGESHYIRSATFWKNQHGPNAELNSIVYGPPSGIVYPDGQQNTVRLVPTAKFFWVTTYPGLTSGHFSGQFIDGAAYFTSFSGGDTEFHNVSVQIRRQGFDPKISHEPRQRADQRKNYLGTAGVVEKAKGVDIGLSVRVLEDAYQDIFDTCYLFTSDIDFLPLVQALQHIGKKVVVFGYLEGLSTRSQLEYVPDAFVDLGEHMRTHCAYRETGETPSKLEPNTHA